MRKFKPSCSMICKNCKDKFYSHYAGHFNHCKCYANEEGNKGCAIDDTAYYCRYIGNPENYEIVPFDYAKNEDTQ